MTSLNRIVSLVLAWQLSLVLPLAGQEAASPQGLRILALEGDNAVNYIPLRTVTAPVVEVRDENDRPLEGAVVTFKALSTSAGVGGSFEGGQSSQTARTDYRGQAGARGYTVTDKPGRFVIEVMAVHAQRTARLMMTQTNSMSSIATETPIVAKRSSKKKWLLISAAAAGGGLALYFGLRGSSPISISAGPVVLGGPR